MWLRRILSAIVLVLSSLMIVGSPAGAADIPGAVVVSSQRGSSCALLDTGQIKCWGNNAVGQLGNGTNTNSNRPVTVTGIGSPQGDDASFRVLFNEKQLHRGHSIVLRLYWAVLNREPELGGATFWINSYNSGEWSTRRIAGFFTTSDEFIKLYGPSVSNSEFVNLAYQNVLGRIPDQKGYNYWFGQVEAGMAREEMILLVSNADEFINSHPLPSDTTADTGPQG